MKKIGPQLATAVAAFVFAGFGATASAAPMTGTKSVAHVAQQTSSAVTTVHYRHGEHHFVRHVHGIRHYYTGRRYYDGRQYGHRYHRVRADEDVWPTVTLLSASTLLDDGYTYGNRYYVYDNDSDDDSCDD